MTDIFDIKSGEFIGEMPEGWSGRWDEDYLDNLGIKPKYPKKKKSKLFKEVWMAS